MKKLLELGNRYAANSTWVDYALVKFCLCAMGLVIGVLLPKKSRKSVALGASAVFVGTYAVLMKKVFDIAKEMKAEASAE